MRVTIQDIAKRMNVSANTVSKALNGKDKVSERLRAEIERTAREMGYVKNKNAARMAQKTVRITAIIVGVDQNFYRYLIKGLERAREALADCRAELTVHILPRDGETERKAAELLDGLGQADGLIIADLLYDGLEDRLAGLRASGVAVSLLNYDLQPACRDFSVQNDYACAAGLAADLIAASCRNDRRPAAVFPSVTNHPGQKSLREEFADRLREYGREAVMPRSERELLDSCAAGKFSAVYITHATYLPVCRFLKEQLPKEKRPVLVVSDLYEEGVPFLTDGIITGIIYQEPEEQAYLAAASLYRMLCEGETPDGVLRIKPLLLMKSNYQNYL